MGGGGHPDGHYHPKVVGHVNYMLSSNRQRYFYGFFSKAPEKFLKKVKGSVFWLPGLGLGYAVYVWANWKEQQIKIDHRL